MYKNQEVETISDSSKNADIKVPFHLARINETFQVIENDHCFLSVIGLEKVMRFIIFGNNVSTAKKKKVPKFLKNFLKPV